MKILIILYLIFFSVAINAGQKVILATGEWAPYTSEKIKGHGFFTEIVSAVCKEAGLDIEYRFYPWLRCERSLKNGEAFAAFPYKRTDDRKLNFNFSAPLAKSTDKFFYLKNKIISEVKWNKFEDLKVYKIGGTFGYWYQKPFERAGLKIDLGYDDERGIKKLWGGRFDLLATNELVGWSLIKKMFPEDINKFDVVKKDLSSDALRLMMSRTYPDASAITKKINIAIKIIKKNGIYEKIIKKHN